MAIMMAGSTPTSMQKLCQGLPCPGLKGWLRTMPLIAQLVPRGLDFREISGDREPG